MDSLSESLDFEFGADSGVEDLEMDFVDDGGRDLRASPQRLAPGERVSAELAPPPSPHFGVELSLPELPKRTKTIIAIAIGGAAGGFLVGGPVGATAGAILGFLMA